MLRTVHSVPVALAIAYLLIFVQPARAEIDVGSDGSDGAFNPASNFSFNLTQAASLCNCDNIDQGNDGNFLDDPCRWDCPSPVPGKGVYDAEQWAVVFKWSSVNIPTGVTVTFPTNHYSRAPVVWLSQGNVQINGTVDVRGRAGSPSVLNPEPGPGGFRGAAPGGGPVFNPPAFGPGGGCSCSHGTYSPLGGGNPALAYGNDGIIPLIGGSGGGSCGSNTSSGAGGGAILVASNTTIFVNGNIFAYGDSGGTGGSGGAIRLVADYVAGNGSLNASRNGNGSLGRIRVEAMEVDLAFPGIPEFVEDLPTFIFPPSNAPKLRATMLGGQPVPDDPASKIGDPDEVDVHLATSGPVTRNIEAENVPPGTVVSVRKIRTGGTGANDGVNNCPTVVQSTLVDAGGGLLTATANLTFAAGYSVVIMRASFTPTALFEQRPQDTFRRNSRDRQGALKTLNDERIVRTEISGSLNGTQQVVYVTDKGRRIPVGR